MSKITSDGLTHWDKQKQWDIIGLNPVWVGMFYSCTHMATVGVKGLIVGRRKQRIEAILAINNGQKVTVTTLMSTRVYSVQLKVWRCHTGRSSPSPLLYSWQHREVRPTPSMDSTSYRSLLLRSVRSRYHNYTRPNNHTTLPMHGVFFTTPVWLINAPRGSTMVLLGSVGIDLNSWGGQMSKCLKFCPGVEI